MANNVKAARERAGIKQAALAERSGIPQGTISRIENGQVPLVPMAMRLAAALETTVEALFGSLPDTSGPDVPPGPTGEGQAQCGDADDQPDDAPARLPRGAFDLAATGT